MEKYIEKCVRSLFEQTMTEGIEFIFINDCTKDKSIEILRKILLDYPNRQSQVRIINHLYNQGLAEARVTGLNAARGEYVIHCDSDDWVEPSMYEDLYQKAIKTDADIVGCDYIKVSTDGILRVKCDFSLPQNQLLRELIRGNKVEAYLWNRLIKRRFYQQGSYRADKEITFLEDMAVTVPMHLNTHKVEYVPKPLYYYRRSDKNSMSQGSQDRNIKSAIRVLSKLSLIPMNEELKKEITLRLKFYLLARIMAPSVRNIEDWRVYERHIIEEKKIATSSFERLNISLVDKRLTLVQYILMAGSKILTKIKTYLK